jgi:hypothetical protein
MAAVARLAFEKMERGTGWSFSLSLALSISHASNRPPCCVGGERVKGILRCW